MAGNWFKKQPGQDPYSKAAQRYNQMGDEEKIRAAAKTAGTDLASSLSSHYLRNGQTSLLNAVQVWESDSNVHVGIHPSNKNHAQAMLNEWGSPNSAPSGVLRAVAHQHSNQTRHIFMNHLGQA